MKTPSVEIDVKTSLNVDTVNENPYVFGTPAPSNKNTGVIKNGGIQNIHETEETNTIAGEYLYTDQGDKLALDPSGNFYKNDVKQGTVSPLGIQSTHSINGAFDTMLLSTGYVTHTLIGTSIVITEFDFNDVQLNTRTVTFPNLSAVLPFITSINVIRNSTYTYAQNQEWIVRIGDQASFLNESNPSVTIGRFFQSTLVIGGNAVLAMHIVNNILYVGGVGGRLGSFDGTNWKNYNGTGNGIGGYSDGTITTSLCIGTNNIRALGSLNGILYIGGVGGRLASYDGASFKNYDGTGTGSGLASNAVICGANDINCMANWKDYLVIGANGGLIGAILGAVSYPYTTAVSTSIVNQVPTSNTTAISTNNILSMAVIPSTANNNENPILVVGGVNGAYASFNGGWVGQTGTLSPTQATAISTYLMQTTTAPASSWIGIAYGAGKFVAIANTTSTTAGIATSPDGVTWTFITSSTITSSWRSITYCGGLFFALLGTTAANTRIYTSPDGITWTLQTTATPSGTWESVTYGNGVYVAVASSPTTTTSIAYSSDGITWNFATTTAPGGSGWYSVTYGNGVFVAVALTTSTTLGIATSPDGITWTFRTTTAPGGSGWRRVTYGNGRFVAVALTTSTTAGIAYSNDGTTWTYDTTTAPGGSGWYDVAYGNGFFVALALSTSTSASLATSPDGITWTYRTTPAVTGNLGAITYGNSLFAIIANVATASGVITSQTYNTIGIFGNGTLVSTDTINAMTVDPSGNIYVGSSAGKVATLNINSYRSYLGAGVPYPLPTEALYTMPSGQFLQGVAFGAGLYIGVTASTALTGSIIKSSDGINWSSVTLPSIPGGNWTGVTYGNGLFVAVAQTTSTTAGIATSPDGIAWTFQTTTSPGGSWRAVTYGNGVFIAAALTTSTTAGIATSPNGTAWTFQTSTAPGGTWRAVTYGNGIFVAIASTASTTAGIAYSINNGVTWTYATTTAPGGAWVSVAYAPSTAKFIALAQTTSTTAGIATSPDGNVWTYRTTSAPAAAWASVAESNGVIVAVASSASLTASMATSPDGITWTYKTWLDVNLGLLTKCYGANNQIFIATDGSSERFLYWKTNPSLAYNNATAIGAVAISSLAWFQSKLIVASTLLSATVGRMASFDGTNWKNYDGTGSGTGPYINSTPASGINAMATNGTFLYLGYQSGFVNTMDLSFAYSPINVNSLSGAINLNSVYCYKYEASAGYLWLVVNNVANVVNFSTDPLTISPTALNGKYAWPEISGGYTRHLITETPRGNGSNVFGISTHGFLLFTNVFTATQTYPTTGYAVSATNSSTTGIQQGLVGWNYVDATFKTTAGTVNQYNLYSPPPVPLSALGYQISQGNTNNLIHGYSKLSNTYGVPASVEFRLVWAFAGTSSFQASISCAVVDGGATDCAGVLLTAVGAFNDTYTPQVNGTVILYKVNDSFNIIRIGTPRTPLQRESIDLYKINTISPLNLWNNSNNKLYPSSLDYNGRVQWLYTGTPSVTFNKAVSLYKSDYSNSIDQGEKLTSLPSTAVIGNIKAFGYRIPYSLGLSDYTVDVYFNNAYLGSWSNEGNSYVQNDPYSPIYIPSPKIPIPIGRIIYDGGAVRDFNTTIILSQDFDGYQIGNEYNGNYIGFSLFGQSFLFDGTKIYLSTLTDGYITDKQQVCIASGLIYLTVSPMEAYFYSPYDNALYTFNGGRNVEKKLPFTQKPTILTASFNVRDNTLLLDTATELLWIRDSITTSNLKKINQLGALKLASTEDGLKLYNNLNTWQYSYIPTGTSTIIPLVWKSAYFGQDRNEKSILSNITLTIYNSDRLPFTANVSAYTFDQEQYHKQTQKFEVKYADYNEVGYVRIRLQPKFQRSLGTAIEFEQLTSVETLLLYDVVAEFQDDTKAILANKRTK